MNDGAESFQDQDFIDEANQQEKDSARQKKRKRQNNNQSAQKAKDATQERSQAEEKAEAVESELQKRAKFLCRDIAEYRSIRNLGDGQLQSWCEQRAFESSQRIKKQVVTAIVHCVSVVMDRLASAKGFVHHELSNDESLQESVGQELESLFYLFSNRMRIIALMACDVANGKKAQLTYNAQHPVVVEETHQEQQPQEEEPK